MTPCEQFEAQVSELFDGELDAAAASACAEHRTACAHCRQLFAELETAIAGLRDPELLQPPAGFAERLRLGLERELPTEAAGARPSRVSWGGPALRWRPLAAAAALLVCFGGVFQLRGTAVVASGWLVDEHCYADYCSHPADHTRQCMLSKACKTSRFGLIDARGKFVPFDQHGSESAVAALETAPDDHIWATVHARKGFSPELRVSQIDLSWAPATAGNGAPTAPAAVQVAYAH